MTAGDAKSALGLLATGLSDVYQTYDIAVGYHTATKTWKIFVRMTTSVQPERQDEYKPATKNAHWKSSWLRRTLCCLSQTRRVLILMRNLRRWNR